MPIRAFLSHDASRRALLAAFAPQPARARRRICARRPRRESRTHAAAAPYEPWRRRRRIPAGRLRGRAPRGARAGRHRTHEHAARSASSRSTLRRGLSVPSAIAALRARRRSPGRCPTTSPTRRRPHPPRSTPTTRGRRAIAPRLGGSCSGTSSATFGVDAPQAWANLAGGRPSGRRGRDRRGARHRRRLRRSRPLRALARLHAQRVRAGLRLRRRTPLSPRTTTATARRSPARSPRRPTTASASPASPTGAADAGARARLAG